MWCGDCPLKEAFPKFYSISWVREASVAEVISISDWRLHWGVQFSHPMQDWELESLALFMDMIYSTSVQVMVLIKFVGSQLRATASVCLKDSVYFTQKTYFFYFTPSLLQNTHISLSIIHTFFIKIIFLLPFSIISHLPPPNPPSFFSES